MKLKALLLFVGGIAFVGCGSDDVTGDDGAGNGGGGSGAKSCVVTGSLTQLGETKSCATQYANVAMFTSKNLCDTQENGFAAVRANPSASLYSSFNCKASWE